VVCFSGRDVEAVRQVAVFPPWVENEFRNIMKLNDKNSLVTVN